MHGCQKNWILAMVSDASDITGPSSTTGHNIGDGTTF